MKFDGKFSKRKLMSRLSHKVYRLLSSPVLLRKFTNSLNCCGEKKDNIFLKILIYILCPRLRVCVIFLKRAKLMLFYYTSVLLY